KNLEKSIEPDVIFTTSGPAYWRPHAPHLVGYNLGHYIYNDSPYFSQIPFRKSFKWFLKGEVIKFFFRKETDVFVVQTDDVNRRLRKMLNTDEVYTVSNTFSHYYRNSKKVKNKLQDKKDGIFRFLTLSAWYQHKNLTIIPEVVSALPANIKEKVKFVLTLPSNEFEKHFNGNRKKNILNIGPVKPEEGPSLYKECDALFLPTLLECFSASYAEAMVMDKPIVTTDLGFARSVCGAAALYYSPVDPDDAAEQIKKLVENKKQQEDLIKKGRQQLAHFNSPRERAQKYLSLCKSLTSKRKN
ncbi:MAG TPA: glycosyltransferase, partial [Balneolaceae bacterium]|nr:glycosyltransferase [Balneolaceae bacterium]